jgi:hypothetical protein
MSQPHAANQREVRLSRKEMTRMGACYDFDLLCIGSGPAGQSAAIWPPNDGTHSHWTGGLGVWGCFGTSYGPCSTTSHWPNATKLPH